MKLAVLGGSFNPVHNGHLALAFRAANEYAYERVLFIPAWEPPHKELAAGASAGERFAMLELALKEYGDFRFQADDCELRRGGRSYTIDTVESLLLRYKDVLDGKIGLIIGSDLAGGFGEWKQASLLAEKTTVILGRRFDSAEKNADSCVIDKTIVPDFAWPHVQLHNDLCDISSEKIRRMIREKKEWKSLVPRSVYEYIVTRKLYGLS